MLCEAGDNGGGHGGGSGLRLFGVQVRIGGGGGAGSSASMKKSYSMDCLQLAAPAGCSLVSPSSSSSSSLLLSIEEGLERGTANGYLSDGPHGRVVQERKKGTSRTEQFIYFFLVLFFCLNEHMHSLGTTCFYFSEEKDKRGRFVSLEIQKLFFTRIPFLIGSTVPQSDLKKVALCFTFLVKKSRFIFP